MHRDANQAASLFDQAFVDNQGNLDRPIGSRSWPVSQSIALDSEKERLVMSARAWSPPSVVNFKGPGQHMLVRFLKLAKAPPETILEYARTWGILFTCEQHNLPCSHNPPPFTVRSLVVESSSWCLPQRSADGGYWETVETWRGFARLMQSLLSVGAYLHHKKEPRPHDWETIFTERYGLVVLLNETPIEHWRFAQDFPEMWKEQPDIQWRVVERIVNLMLEWGNVRPILHLNDNRTPTIVLGGEGLFGALVIQLMLLTSRTGGVAICIACGEVYHPKRRPRNDQRNYCSNSPCLKARSCATSRDSKARKQNGLLKC